MTDLDGMCDGKLGEDFGWMICLLQMASLDKLCSEGFHLDESLAHFVK